MPTRQHEVTRLEGFSDAVFGFSLTLLVVSLEPIRSSDELMLLARRSSAFALTFAMVCYIWWEHNKFFRRYGLQDAWTAFVNAVLLFVVVFYVYPLKFLTTSILARFHWLPEQDLPQAFDGRFVMLLYSTGVVLIFGLFVLLYRHAWAKRAELGLSAADELTLKYGRRAHVLSASLGVASILLVAVHRDDAQLWIPGVIYGLMGPLHAWNGYSAGRAHEALRAAS
jgi:uncharacterized membrane protein